MGYRKVSSLAQICHVLKYKVESWLEWQDAKAWAKYYHPAWVEIVKRTKSEAARAYYKKMILDAYRGCDNGK